MVWIGEDDPDWIENHIAAYVNIAGPVLGVSKSMTSLLSGDIAFLPYLRMFCTAAHQQHTVTWYACDLIRSKHSRLKGNR